jgi:hypothetical protein
MAVKADQAIAKALLYGSNQMHFPPRSEIGFVAAVTLTGIWDIAKAWTSLCENHGLKLELSGVFCHAAPKVLFSGTKTRPSRCELADLLVVVDITTAGNLVRRATLIQAKMARAAGRVSLSGASSAVQLDLYQNWYLFDFEEAIYGLKGIDLKAGGGRPKFWKFRGR